MLNQASIDLIKRFEGWRANAYVDPATGGDPITIGYGHTSAAGPPKVKMGMKISMEEGEAILRRDLEAIEATVSKAVTVPLNENQYGALVSFTFNLGAGNFRKSTLLKLVNARDPLAASKEFAKWNKAAGKVMKGLTTRRAAEAELFLKPAPGRVLPKAEPIIPIQEKPMEEFETPLAEPSKAITFNWFPWALGAAVIGIVLWLFFNLRF